jgi:hypothetical protein
MRYEKRYRLIGKKSPVVYWGPTEWRGVMVDHPLFTDSKGKPKRVQTQHLFELNEPPVKLFLKNDINRRKNWNQ